MVGPAAAIERTASSFMGVLKEQPLSLALVVMNFLLVAYLFYAGAGQLAQRTEMSKEVLHWTQTTDKLLASCISMDVTKLMFDNMQRITDTMLTAEREQISRMQQAIDREREINTRLQGLPPPPRVAPAPAPAPASPKSEP